MPASQLGRSTVRFPTVSPQRARANPSDSTVQSGEYKADARKSGSSSPFVCALATTSGDTRVRKFYCGPEPVIANFLELS